MHPERKTRCAVPKPSLNRWRFSYRKVWRNLNSNYCGKRFLSFFRSASALHCWLDNSLKIAGRTHLRSIVVRLRFLLPFQRLQSSFIHKFHVVFRSKHCSHCTRNPNKIKCKFMKHRTEKKCNELLEMNSNEMTLFCSPTRTRAHQTRHCIAFFSFEQQRKSETILVSNAKKNSLSNGKEWSARNQWRKSTKVNGNFAGNDSNRAK